MGRLRSIPAPKNANDWHVAQTYSLLKVNQSLAGLSAKKCSSFLQERDKKY